MDGKKEIQKPIQQALIQQSSAGSIKTQFSVIQSQRRLDMRAISRPIQSEADILQYFHYWRSRIPDNVKTYSRLSVQQRQVIKRKLRICHQYGERYLQPFLAVWYSYLILCINKAFPQQPQLMFSQSELEGIFAQIYQTHKQPLEQLLQFPKKMKVQQSEPKESKTFIGLIVTNIMAFFSKSEKRFHEPEQQKMTKKN